MHVEVIDSEGSFGPIHLEITLKHTTVQKGARALSLGSVLVPLSAEPLVWLARHPANEMLTFPFPRNAQLKAFNEITVAVKPLNDRVPRGAHLAIRKFTLVP